MAAQVNHLARRVMREPDNRVVRGHPGVVAVAHCLRKAVELCARKRVAVTRPHIRGNGDVRRPPGSEWRPGSRIRCVKEQRAALRAAEKLSSGEKKKARLPGEVAGGERR